MANFDFKETFLNPIFKGNPISVLVLGICSSLAVTVQLKGAFVMGLSVIIAASCEQWLGGWRQSLFPINEHLAPHSLCFINEFIVVKIYLTNWLTFHSMIGICCLIRWD